MLTDIKLGTVGKQFSGVNKQVHKLLASEIWTLVHKRSPPDVVDWELKINENFRNYVIKKLIIVTNSMVFMYYRNKIM